MIGIDEALYKACEDNRKLEVEIEEKDKEINRLNNIIDEFQRNYIEIIKRCDEMIKNKYYSNAIAIDKYANEIKNTLKYYVPDAEWIELKGDNK